MKKVVLALAILVLSTPALADSNGVTVEVNQVGDTNVMYVAYAMNNVADVNRPRAFGLIIEVDNANMGEPYDFDPNFYIYPGSIDINVDAPEGQEVNSWGSPIADYNDPNDDAIMEMASLYYPTGVSSPNRPPYSGILFKFGIDKTDDFFVNIEEDAQRGGVVMEDIDHPDVNDPGYVTLVDYNALPIGCTVPNILDMTPSAANTAITNASLTVGTVSYTASCASDFNVVSQSPSGGAGVSCGSAVDYTICECYYGQADYSTWDEVGKPLCWCYPRQCHGDADGGYYPASANENKRKWVTSDDLDIMAVGWQKKVTEITQEQFATAICADFDHGFYPASANINKRKWVTSDDLDIMAGNWQKKVTEAGANTDPNCEPGNRTP